MCSAHANYAEELQFTSLLYPLPIPLCFELLVLPGQTLRLPLELFKRCATAPNDTKLLALQLADWGHI